jgi:hypothetical protein
MGKTKDGLAPDGLTDQQRAFCEHYSKSFNATAAADAAGYKHPRVQGPRMLGIPSVIKYLSTISKRTAKKHQIDRDWIVRRLKRAIDFDPGSILEVDDGGNIDFKRNKKLPKGALKYIAFTQSYGKGGSSISFRHRDSYEKMLELMARMNGCVTGERPSANPRASDATRERVLGSLRKRAGR